MKTLLCSALTLSFVGLLTGEAAADLPVSPRFWALVACYNGAVDESGVCRGTCFQPDGKMFTEGKMTCGAPGRVAEIIWSFVGQRGGKDVYRFTRRFPLDTPDLAVSSKEVEFSGQRVVIFQDGSQALLMEPPKP